MKKLSLALVIVGLMVGTAQTETISLKKDGSVYYVPAQINSVITLDFLIDTGASGVVIPEDVVLTLIRTGTLDVTDMLPPSTYALADGSTHAGRNVRLRVLKVGSFTFTNVRAGVVPSGAGLILGQSILEGLKGWRLDSERRLLYTGQNSLQEERRVVNIPAPPPTISTVPLAAMATPQEPRVIGIIPHQAVWNFRLGMTKKEVLKLGVPQIRGELEAERSYAIGMGMRPSYMWLSPGVVSEWWTYINKTSNNRLEVLFLGNHIGAVCFTRSDWDTMEGITTANMDAPNENLVYEYDGGNHITHSTYTYKKGGLFYTISDDGSRTGCVIK